MKARQTALRLVFLGLLVALIISRPAAVSASGGTYYQCPSSIYSESCFSDAMQYINQCTTDCMDAGGSDYYSCNTFTEYVFYPEMVNGQWDGDYDVWPDQETTCALVPHSGLTCIEQCEQNFLSMQTSCYAQYCVEKSS